MRIITGAIGSCKTVAMIKRCCAHNLTILTRNYETKSFLQETARNLYFKLKEPETYSDFFKEDNSVGREKEKFFIEDIASFLEFIFQPNCSIEGFVCEGEDVSVLTRETIMEKIFVFTEKLLAETIDCNG